MAILAKIVEERKLANNYSAGRFFGESGKIY